MIAIGRLIIANVSRNDAGTAPTTTRGMDSFERPLPPIGLSAAEQALRRPSMVTRRNSFSGGVDHLLGPIETSHVWEASLVDSAAHLRAPMAATPPSFGPMSPTQTPARRPSGAPVVQLVVPEFHDRRSRLAQVATFACEIDQLEHQLREKMGWLAIDGVRNLTSISAGMASVIGLAFSIIALTAAHLLPGLGLIVFASVLLGGIVVGVLAQTLARWLWARRNDTAPLRAELNAIRTRLLAQAPDGRIESLLDSEIRQLRRLERLEVRLDGGFFNTLGDALIGTFGWDPRLGDMLGRAAKSRRAAPTAGTQPDAQPALRRGRARPATAARRAAPARRQAVPPQPAQGTTRRAAPGATGGRLRSAAQAMVFGQSSRRTATATGAATRTTAQNRPVRSRS